MSTRRVVPVKAAVRMMKQMLFGYQGHVQAALIIGGVDTLGPYIISIAPHGSSDNAPYLAMGSGSIAAMSVLETHFRPDMTAEEAVKLVRDAINAGVTNDLFSGSNIDICIITMEGAQVVRPYEQNQPDVLKKENNYTFPRGKTVVLNQNVRKIDYTVHSQEIRKTQEEPMETSWEKRRKFSVFGFFLLFFRGCKVFFYSTVMIVSFVLFFPTEKNRQFFLGSFFPRRSQQSGWKKREKIFRKFTKTKVSNVDRHRKKIENFVCFSFRAVIAFPPPPRKK